MKVVLHGFGSTRNLRGYSFVMDKSASVAEIRQYLQLTLLTDAKFADLVPIFATCAFASEDEVLEESMVISTDVVLNILPPVCGG